MISLRALIGTLIFISAVPFLFSQERTTHSDIFELKKLSLSDGREMNIQQDTVKPFRMKKSPWGAVLRSAILPGFGQFYNESYWKIPVILGLLGYFGYQIHDNHSQYADYREKYKSTQTEENPAGNQNLKIFREFYRDQRDEFIWYFGIVYLINLVDAYVDAHLFDFDVSEENPSSSGGKKYILKFNLLKAFHSF